MSWTGNILNVAGLQPVDKAEYAKYMSKFIDGMVKHYLKDFFGIITPENVKDYLVNVKGIRLRGEKLDHLINIGIKWLNGAEASKGVEKKE